MSPDSSPDKSPGKSRERLLVVAAHPDDEVLGCGATIARFRAEGGAVRVLFLAEGVTARYDPEQFDTPKVRAESEARNANALKALALLGVEKEEVRLQTRYCCRLDQVPQIDLVKEIEREIRDFQPTQLFTHWQGDSNIDHRMAQEAVLAAVRPLAIPFLRRIMAFEVLSSTEWNPTQPFLANAFIETTAFMDAKIAAMAAYGDEMREAPHPRSEAVIRALATFRGSQAGVTAAEAFSLIRSLD